MKTTETQTVRVNGSTGGTFTLTFGGETTAPIAWNATAADVAAALAALGTVGDDDLTATGGPVNTANVTLLWKGQYLQQNIEPPTATTSGLTGPEPGGRGQHHGAGRLLQRPVRRRPAVRAEHQRPARQGHADQGATPTAPTPSRAATCSPAGDGARPGPRSTRWASATRSASTVDDAGVAYVTDYSPDSQTPQQFRGPAGTGRVEVVRKPANYGWPLCYSPDLPYYRWNFITTTPLDSPAAGARVQQPQPGPAQHSRWNPRADRP